MQRVVMDYLAQFRNMSKIILGVKIVIEDNAIEDDPEHPCALYSLPLTP